MKLNVEKALKVCGNNNFYQKLLYIAVALSWFSVDFVSISFPLLELEPKFECKNNNNGFRVCSAKEACSLNQSDYRVEILYRNLLTDYNLYCETTLVILIGVLYTSGILIGSIMASHFSDVLGRKPVLLICQVLFGLSAISMTIAPNMYFVLCALFFTGFASAGGTMVSFLYIYEILAPAKRSLYGTLINFSFALAGMIYFTCFRYLKNWVYIAYLCIVADIIAFLLVSLYFVESPRFLVSKGQYEKALKMLYKIAKKNNKSRDFYTYVLSDMLYKSDLKEDNFNSKNDEENSEYFNNLYENKSSGKSQACPQLKAKSSFNKNININNNSIASDKNLNDQKTSNEFIEGDNKSEEFNNSKGSSRERSESFDSKKMDIDEFIKSMRSKENSNSDLDNEKKNEPLLISSKSTNFTDSKPSGEENKKEQGFMALFKYRSLRYKFLVCSLFWFVMSFVYYGMSFFLKKGGEDVFVDGYVIYLAEGISYFITGIIISLSFLGRVRSLRIMFALSSISTITFYFLKNVPGYLNKIPLFTARFSITSIYSIMYTYSTEIYPTSIRAKGLGFNSFFARIASISVPIIVELIDNPFLIFSIMAGFSLLFTFNIPETNNKELEDEIFEEKILNKKISIDTN